MAAIRAAATVVLLRDRNDVQEVLLLRRNRQLKFAAGAWVFPGGAVDKEELVGRTEEDAARLAAVRECAEEADLRIDSATLQLFAHWVTPEASPKRFSTWFYMQNLPGELEVQVDGGEITESLWGAPGELLARHRRGELPLMPPTYVTLTELAQQRSSVQSVAAFAERPLLKFLPRMVMQSERVCFLYQEDAGYAAQNADVIGARHRCYMDDSGCHYECDF